MKISKKAALLALGVGALAIYKYNKMTDEEKTALKDKGKKMFDDHISPFLKNLLGMTEDPALLAQTQQPAKV